MKSISLVFTFLLFLSACSEPAPGTTVQLKQGQSIDLLNHPDHWLVINYWASWCKPCIEEIPELNKFMRARPDVHIVGVNFDGLSGEALNEQITAIGMEFSPLEQDPFSLLGYDRPVVLPVTYIFTPSGKLVAELAGPQTLESLLAATNNNHDG
ncbi:MAG: TlpA disulfide reductase family protein [Pseudomonadales bacterium]